MDVNNVPENTGEKQGGKFVKGESGNPHGRPKGSLNNTTKIAMTLIDSEIEAVTRKAIELALNGDMQAIKLILERTLPVRKERPIGIELPELKCTKDIAEANKLIVVGLSNGTLTLSEANLLMTFLNALEKSSNDKKFNWDF